MGGRFRGNLLGGVLVLVTLSGLSPPSSAPAPLVQVESGGLEASEGRATYLFFEAAAALILAGAVLASRFGLIADVAAWALVASAAIRISFARGDGCKAAGGKASRFREVASLFGGGAMAAAMGFAALAVFVADASVSLKIAAAVAAVGYAALAPGQEGTRPVVLELQTVAALLPLAAGMAVKWDLYAPIALACLLCLALALIHESRRRFGAAAAQETGRRYVATLDGAEQSLAMFDAAARLIAANHAFFRMFRLTEETAQEARIDDLLAQKLALRLAEPEAARQLIDAAGAARRNRQRESAIVALADGRFMEFVFHPTRDGFSLQIEDVTRWRASELRFERLARQDDVTGLRNRNAYFEELEKAASRLDESAPFAVLMIDLDRFKQVNDSLGHPVGDKLLKRVAERLQELAAPQDIVARLGGDEFVVLRLGDREGAAAFAAQAVEAVGDPYHLGGVKLLIGASIGIAITPDDGANADELMQAADMALYAAKDAGRGVFRFFEKSMAEEARRRQEIEQDLRLGITRNELEVYYQPIVSLARRRICACEALARWRHPRLGMISPGEFMDIAEESGLVIPLGEWVLRQACIDAKSWPKDVRLAVNFSPVQFARGNVAETVKRILNDTKFPAERLEMEITESVLMADADSVLATINELRELGMRVALDDFGAGYSSLAYLGRFRPNKVKIDQFFVRDMDENPASLAIIKAVKALVAELGVELLAEGVETVEQLEILRENGADEAQGFLFSKPRPAREIARFVADPAQLVRGRKLITESAVPWAKTCERVSPVVARSR